MTVVDEPEVYLHPDLQRQLLGLLRDHTNDFVIATHSTEIIGDADPAEILIVDKNKHSAKRVRDVEGVQEALDALGSIQNMTLTQLARNKRVLFTEGGHDYKIIRRFAKKLKYIELAAGNDITQLESGGYSSWPKVRALAWGLKNTLGADIQIGAVYDRDYWCEAETDKVLLDLKNDLKFAHIHLRKEIENYLLVPSVLDRCVKAALREKTKRGSLAAEDDRHVDTHKILDQLSTKFQTELQGQYISKFSEFHKSQGKDGATLAREALDFFNMKWSHLDKRMEIVCGKTILKELRGYALDTWGVSLTDFKIIDEFRADEVPVDLYLLIKNLEEYRLSNYL
jgi:predicted ATP-dependent endonuclease of OLD family